MEDLLTLHRKQLRDLQSVITQKKKSATKKTRRGVNDDCERLERELKEKQASEVVALEKELNPNSAADGDENEGSSETVVGDNPELEEEKEEQDISSKLQETTLEDPTTATNHERIEPPSSSSSSSKKPNRAKARLARRAAQIEEITAQAQQEAATQPNPRAIEAERMKQLFAENGLTEIQIAPDGHCLYSAFATGLEGAGIPLSDESTSSSLEGTKQRGYTFTRKAAGRKVTSTAEWGGQMELLALAKEYGVTVKVVQAQGVGVTAMNEEEGEKADVWLAYHRKGYGLGEHYNALRKK
ncbi:hypothetical protein TWF703_003880 [Orbilia oligospora]|uniref:OTU domain-containing protein n=1 Tax=Orbilia oligospora TaxID=2813651 RepID=A0A7C8JTV5_ORBOL|nr:hypothetical protein TWF703_003880 [Orbilia oligospora]